MLLVAALFMFLFNEIYAQGCCQDCTHGMFLKPNTNFLYVHKNENITIDCISGPAASGNDHSYLKWSYVNSFINPYNMKSTSLPDLHLAEDLCDVERLVILNFRKENEGVYTCERIEANSTTFDRSDIIKKTVNISMISPSQPGIVLNNINPFNVLHNTRTILSCSALGSPIPTIRWFHGRNVMKVCHKWSLCNISVFVSTNQSYVCHAENYLGVAEEVVSVISVEPPILIKSYQSIGDMHLSCSIKDIYPIPSFIWQYQVCMKTANCSNNDIKWMNISSGNTYKVSTSTFRSTLNILERPLYAHIRCVVYNSVGNDTKVYKVSLKESDSEETQLIVIMMAVGVAVLVFLIIAIVVILIRRKIRNKYARFMSPYSDYQVKSDINLMDQGLHLPYDISWEYPRNKLEFIKVLGSGAFGQVWLARAVYIHHYQYYKAENFSNSMGRKRKLSLYEYMKRSNRNNNNKTSDNGFVAVKTLKNEASDTEYKDLASEIKVLIHIGKHRHIVNLLGACTRNGSLFAIMEYCPYGDLKSFLKSKRSCYSNHWTTYLNEMSEQIGLGDLCSIAFQIAKGMDFLHSKNLIHRDLATRNILLGDRCCVKISDFGLARSIETVGNYVKTTGGLLPVKWMSPESLIDRVYNTKTDVWSFAITLWELFTLGGSPYPGVAVEVLFDYVYDGNRMMQPETCPDNMFRVMKECWSQIPSDRPDFQGIADTINGILHEYMPNNLYLKEIGNEDDMSAVQFSQDLDSTDHNTMKRGSKKFSLAGLADFMAQRTWRPLSHGSEDHLLSSRLSSTNSEVFEKVA